MKEIKITKITVRVLLLILLCVSICLIIGMFDSVNIASADSTVVLKDSGIYAIKNKATGYYLSVSSQGSQMVQWTKELDKKQRFQIRKINSNDWAIYQDRVSVGVITDFGGALDVSAGSSADNAEILLWEINGNKNQLFRFQKNNDNSFKILTGASNYQKCIGIERNGKAPGMKCLQMAQSNETSSWVFEELWGFSYLKNSYEINQNYPVAKTDKTFGVPKLMNEKITRGSRLSAKSVFGTTKSEDCDMYLYRYWRYNVPLNVRVYDFNRNLSLNPMQTYTYTNSVTQSFTQTKSESITAGLSFSKNSALGAGLNLEIFSLDYSNKNSFLANLTTQFSYTTSNTFTVSEQETISLKMPENVENKPYHYKLEVRAMMYLYYVQIFYLIDERTETKDGIWTNYHYSRVGSACMQEQFHWEMLTPYKGLNPYKLDAEKGAYIYCGIKENCIYV